MLTADEVLENYYLEVRCMLLEIAATLDRYDRARDAAANGKPSGDERLDKIFQSLSLLADESGTPDRSERLLNLFSDLD